MPRLAFNRKDTGLRTDGGEVRIAAGFSQQDWCWFGRCPPLRGGSSSELLNQNHIKTMDFQCSFESAVHVSQGGQLAGNAFSVAVS
jgi:hypothetical protein